MTSPEERAPSQPQDMERILRSISTERAVSLSQEFASAEGTNTDGLEGRVTRALSETRADFDAMKASLAENPLAEEEEFVLIPNLLPNEERSVHELLLQAVEPDSHIIDGADKLIRDENGLITTIVQYRDCPKVAPIRSADGTVHRWYVRRIANLGEDVDFGDVRVQQGKSSEHLILRRTVTPKVLINPSVN